MKHFTPEQCHEDLKFVQGYQEWMKHWVTFEGGVYTLWDPSYHAFASTTNKSDIPSLFKKSDYAKG